MLSLQGNTAPYLQNAYVRIQSIFRKADSAWITHSRISRITLGQPAELVLAKRLCPVRRSRPHHPERLPPEHPRQLPLRIGQQLPRLLRSLPRPEIRRARSQLPPRLVSAHRPHSPARPRLARHRSARSHVSRWQRRPAGRDGSQASCLTRPTGFQPVGPTSTPPPDYCPRATEIAGANGEGSVVQMQNREAVRGL